MRSISHPPFSILAAAILASVVAPVVHAQGDESGDLDKIVVTATRTDQSLRRTLAAVTVLDRTQIERLQAATLQDLLRAQPGLSIANQGGAGKLTGLSLRGTGSGQVLVLVDGIKIGAASAGMSMIQDIPLEQVERIEIVRGPASSLYGSEAVGGVIQVFTRKGTGGYRPNASVTAGSHGLRGGGFGIGGGDADQWLALQFAHQQTDGIDACRGSGTLFSGCFTNEPDRDGYRNTSLSLSGGRALGDGWTVQGRAFWAGGENHYDGSFVNRSEVAQRVLSARVGYAPSAVWNVSATFGRSDDLANNFKDARFRNRMDTYRDVANVQAEYAIDSGVLSAGVDWQRERLSSTTAFDKTSRDTRGLYAQWLGHYGAHQLQLAARHEDNSQFGDRVTGNANWGWQFTDALRVNVAYGTAFRAPTFNDLYYPGYSNPQLRPETARTAEIGLRGTPAWGRWSINAYENRMVDLIALDASTWLPINIQRARIRGAEATLGLTLDAWNIAASASWIDPRNHTPGALFDKVLPRRARQIGRIDVDRTFGAWSLGATINGEGGRFDDVANRVALGGFATTDLRVGYAVSSALSLQVAARNVFDRRYETVAWYNQPGREWQVTLRYNPAK